MNFSFATDLEVTVTDHGRLDLYSPGAGAEVCCEGADIAMWIALRLNDGDITPAAELLSSLWQEDLADIRFELWSWVHQLWSVGLLRKEVPAT